MEYFLLLHRYYPDIIHYFQFSGLRFCFTFLIDYLLLLIKEKTKMMFVISLNVYPNVLFFSTLAWQIHRRGSEMQTVVLPG